MTQAQRGAKRTRRIDVLWEICSCVVFLLLYIITSDKGRITIPSRDFVFEARELEAGVFKTQSGISEVERSTPPDSQHTTHARSGHLCVWRLPIEIQQTDPPTLVWSEASLDLVLSQNSSDIKPRCLKRFDDDGRP